MMARNQMAWYTEARNEHARIRKSPRKACTDADAKAFNKRPFMRQEDASATIMSARRSLSFLDVQHHNFAVHAYVAFRST